VLPSGQALGFQQMRVGEDEADSTLDNALSMAPLFSLKKAAAIRQVREVVAVVNEWRKHYAGCGVTQRDIDLYAEQIDRPFLLEQRREFMS